jgi:hypothetical protein
LFRNEDSINSLEMFPLLHVLFCFFGSTRKLSVSSCLFILMHLVFCNSSQIYFSTACILVMFLIHNTSGKFVPMPSCHLAMKNYSWVGWKRRPEHLNFGGDEC